MHGPQAVFTVCHCEFCASKAVQ